MVILILEKMMQKWSFITDSTVSEIKKIIVNVSLPAVRFFSLLYVDLQPEYFWFFPIILTNCVFLKFYCIGLHRFLNVNSDYFPVLITGFEYGIFGIGPFGAA